MINHLNVQNFSAYGVVLHENPERSVQPDSAWQLLEDLEVGEDLSHLYRLTSGELLIELRDGVALLSVSFQSDLTDLKTFLLDKKVVLNHPLNFCIQALNDRCHVMLWVKPGESHCSRLIAEDLDSELLHKPLQVLPRFNILCIYTLFYQEKDRGFRFNGERHPFWELTYVDKASLVTEVDGKRFKLQQGDAIFYSPGQFHCQYSDAEVAANFITVTFGMAMQDESLITNQVFHLKREQVDILNRILREKDNPSYFTDDLILCYLKELVITLVRSNLQVSPVQTLENHLRINVEKDMISRAMSYIHLNLNNKISIAEIAAEVHVSPSYVSAVFKRRQGMTLVEYITHVKLEKSKDMIREGNLNLTEIAKALGFNSVHYYSRLFKTKYSISPSEYSRAIR
ncbi:MAG: AraC family transcriptional regulator [Clostridia bacterium]|nr:AraC family transcriptional regulator [Clostridia bacterium]NCC75936.1 AraC family transcriptional regulator [Clostridia bacterium]